jgi:hypothetical protein
MGLDSEQVLWWGCCCCCCFVSLIDFMSLFIEPLLSLLGRALWVGSQCGEHADDGSDSERKTSCHVHVASLFWLNLHKFCIISSLSFLIEEEVFWLFWFSSNVFIYIYIYIDFLFYLLEVVTSNRGCASILFIQKYLSITNKSILYYLHYFTSVN